MSSHDTIKNDYPTNFGYTPSLYNEQDVIEEESSNFEDSQPVSDQSFGVDDQEWTGGSSAGYGQFSDVDGTNESFEQTRGRSFAFTGKQGSEFDSLDDFTSVEQDFIPPQYGAAKSNAADEGSNQNAVEMGFNAETNLYEGGVEVGEMEDMAYQTETDEFNEEDEELSFPTHDNISINGGVGQQGANESPGQKGIRVGAADPNNNLGGEVTTGDESVTTLPQSARFRQDTLDEISSASEDFMEEDLNEEHNALQFTFQPAPNLPQVQQRQQQPKQTQQNVFPQNKDRALNQSQKQKYSNQFAGPNVRPNITVNNGAGDNFIDDNNLTGFEQSMDNYDETNFDDNTSQGITDFSHPFSNRDSASGQKRESIPKLGQLRTPSSVFGRRDTLDSDAGEEINLHSKNLRQSSFMSELMDDFLRQSSFVSTDTHGTSMPVVYESDVAPTTDRSSLPKGPPRSKNTGRYSSGAGQAANNRGVGITSKIASPPNFLTRASDSEGEMSLNEDYSKRQLFDQLRKEKHHTNKLQEENDAYQARVNDLNYELAITKDCLDQLKVMAHVGLDVNHPDALPGKGTTVNPVKQPNKFEMPKPGRAGVIDPNEKQDRNPEVNPRYNELSGEAQRINSSLQTFCGLIRDGNMHASQHKSFLQRIKREAAQLKSDYDNLNAEMGGLIAPEVKEMMDQQLFQTEFLTSEAEHLFDEIEAQKEQQLQKIEQEQLRLVKEEQELARSRNSLNQIQPQNIEMGMNAPLMEQSQEVTRLAQEVEQLKVMYEMEKLRNSQQNLAVEPLQAPAQLQLNGEQWAKVATSANMNVADLKRVLEDAGVGQVQPRLAPAPIEDEEFIGASNMNNEPNLHNAPEWPNQNFTEDFDANENAYYGNVENLGSVFKPISTHDSSMVAGSIDQQNLASTRNTPALLAGTQVESLRAEGNLPNGNVNSGSLERKHVNQVSQRSGLPKRRSSIPKLDPNFYSQNLTGSGYPRPGDDQIRSGNAPVIIPEQRVIKGRTHFSDRPIQKTYSIDGGLGDSNGSLRRKDRLGAILAATEDNDSGFVGSGPSHFGNVTSETSYSSSRGQTPATAAGSLRRSKNSSVLDRKQPEHILEPKVTGIKDSSLTLKAESGSESGKNNDGDELESLGLESPDSSVGSIKRRPLKTNTQNKPKSSSTPKPAMVAAGIQARVSATNKNSQTTTEHKADAAVGDSDMPRGPYQNPRNLSTKFASPRSSAFKSYISSSTEDNLPLKTGSKPSSSVPRRISSARKHLPFSRRGLVEPVTEKQSPVASGSKFSKSETALENSLHNQSKIDEIEREILEIKADIEQAKQRTKRDSLVSSTPRNDKSVRDSRHLEKSDGHSRPGSFLATHENGNESLRKDSSYLNHQNGYITVQPNMENNSLRRSDSRNALNSSVDHSCSRRLSFVKPTERKTSSVNTTFEPLPSRPTRSKKMQTETIAKTPPVVTSSSDSEDIGNITILESKRERAIANKRSGSDRNPTKSRGTNVFSSDLDSAYDSLYRHRPNRRSSGRVRNVAVETDIPRDIRRDRIPSNVDFEPIGVHTSDGVPVIQQPAAVHQLVTPATVVQQPSPTAGLWMYQQPAGLATAPGALLATNIAQPQFVQTVDHVATGNPIRFYYKSADAAAFIDTEEHQIARSADSLPRRNSSRKYETNAGTKMRVYKGNSSKLLESINSADVAARQLKRLSQSMADSVYTHLNANELS
ncbi:uncharacterized protein LOC142350744 isoform X2 [Convolutriloba macropyga]|uniref:uncharacterized protein LOC142350744 isoform X2 n=1 Tax=Convolutriloba macropyga TaxID=536237 RepID=UPI003F51FF92